MRRVEDVVVPGRPLKLVIASTAATAADFLTLLFLVRAVHLGAGVAAVLGCLVGGALNFTLARQWVFDGAGEAGPMWRQIVAYGACVVLGGAVLVGGLVHLAVQRSGAPLLLARALAAVVVLAAWTYPLSSLLIFRAPPLGEEPLS